MELLSYLNQMYSAILNAKQIRALEPSLGSTIEYSQQ